MNAASALLAIPDAPPTAPAGRPVDADVGAGLLAATRALCETELAPLVNRIDHEGLYPAPIMQRLGALGAFRAHLAAPLGARDYGLAIGAMAEVARVCGATGFLTWCQDVCGLYIEASGNAALIARFLQPQASAALIGGTGMSNPMKTFSGIESMLLRGRRVAGGYLVSGTLPWVSNIGPGRHFGATFHVDDGHQVMFLALCDAPGVLLKACPTFSAMEGTSTFSVRFSDVFVGDELLVADPIAPFLRRIKAAFILLQTGMALGIVRACIEGMVTVEDQLGHVNAYLEDRPDLLAEEAAALEARIMALARDPIDAGPDHLLDVLDVRAHGSELSLRASQSLLMHHGARGYLMSSGPQRRVREAHFVAIVTPALKHLRSEIDRLSRTANPVAGRP